MKRVIIILCLLVGLLLIGCQQKSYTIEFDTNGGNEIASVTIKKLDDFKLPEDPVKEGFVFAGWYIDSDFTEEYKELSEENLKLYAKWEEENHPLSLLSFNAVKEPAPNNKNRRNKSYDSSFEYDEIIDGNQIKLEAVIKNDNRLSFMDMVLYLSYENKTVVFNEGHGEYVCSSTTVYEDGLWLTKIEVLLDLEKSEETHSEVEIIDIYFLSLDKENTKTYLLNANKNKVSFHKHIYNQEIMNENTLYTKATHFDPEYYYYSCECGKIGTNTFENGEPIPHNFVLQISDEKYIANVGDCHTKEAYYYSCECGEKSVYTYELDYVHTLDVTYLNDETLESCGTVRYSCTKCSYNEIEDARALGTIGYESVGTPTLYYELLSDDTYCVAGVGDVNERTKLVIPATYRGKPVTQIKTRAFDAMPMLKTVIIAEGITIIGDFAFAKCSKLTDLTLPSTLKNIETFAFLECESLKSIILPSKLEKLNTQAFFDCVGLEEVTFTSELSEIGESVFQNCVSLQEVIFHNGLEIIGKSAFNNCIALQNINLPDSVKIIGIQAFYGCKKLTSVSTSLNLETIEKRAFEECGELVNIDIKDSLIKIGDYAFYNCRKLEKFNLPSGLETIGSHAFEECIALRNINLPENLVELGEYAFSWCICIDSISIPSKITKINDGVFSWCDKLRVLDLHDNVTHIGNSAFAVTKNLRELKLPDSVVSIGDEAFCYLENVITVNLGNSLKSIGYRALCNLGLKEIELPASLENIGAHAFEFSELKTITIPKNVVSIGDGAFWKSQLETVIFEEGSILKKLSKEIFKDNGCLKSVVLPSSLTHIGYNAFDNCENLAEIIIPKSVTVMENCIFEKCFVITIYCEAASQPSGWDKNWNIENRPVVWNYQNK